MVKVSRFTESIFSLLYGGKAPFKKSSSAPPDRRKPLLSASTGLGTINALGLPKLGRRSELRCRPPGTYPAGYLCPSGRLTDRVRIIQKWTSGPRCLITTDSPVTQHKTHPARGWLQQLVAPGRARALSLLRAAGAGCFPAKLNPAHGPLVGDKLSPYESSRTPGTGGMEEVWKARRTRLDRIVAIKRTKAAHSARFEQEARAVAALNHPHICQIHDVGEDYLVLEYIGGSPLRGSDAARALDLLAFPQWSGLFLVAPEWENMFSTRRIA